MQYGIAYHVGKAAVAVIVIFDDPTVAADWASSRHAGRPELRSGRFQWSEYGPVVLEVFTSPEAATAAIGTQLGESEDGAFEAARQRRAQQEKEVREEAARVKADRLAAKKAAADKAAAERKRAEKRDADLKWLADQGIGPDTIVAIAQLQQIHAARTDTSA